MDIAQLGTAIAAVVGVLVIALVAVVPNVLDLEQGVG
ncbi:hypothetical protein SAMN05421756_101838 [Microlunatus flavus]|uniref:Uncharacterized protein n=1 Tax=Microlunatus flavus TaxID=1036181 RepID=A0A1H9B567_9ACTN|nr:hypothetical protein SAMN05421756_101838 [Microlunatus flavus]